MPFSLRSFRPSGCLGPRSNSDPVDSNAADKDAVEALAAATGSLRHDLSRAGAADKVDALVKLCSTAETAAMFLASLDSTTDGDIVVRARSTDLAPVADGADAVSILIGRLQRLRLRFERELYRLRAIKGPESLISLEILVALLCEMWCQETGQRVTANPYRHNKYVGHPQTDAGRFVLLAVEALRPSKAWIGRHAAVTSHKRTTILTTSQGFQARAVHTAMQKIRRGRKAAAGPDFQQKHTL